MWWQFKSGFARKLGYMAAVALMAFLLGHRAHSQNVCYQYSRVSGTPLWESSTQAACADEASFEAVGQGPGWTGTCAGSSGVGSDAMYSETLTYAGTDASPCTQNCSHTYGPNQLQSKVVPCTPGCGSLPNQDLLATIASSSGNTAGGGYCNNSCEYLNGNTTVSIGGGANRLVGLAVPSGQACGTAAQPGSPQAADLPAAFGSCVAQGGGTSCVTDSPQTANINGDVINPSTIPASGTCQAFTSGGVMCTVPTSGAAVPGQPVALPTPPGPDNGTAGTPAAPTATVVANGQQVNYYNAATAAASSVGVGTKGVTATGAAGAGTVSTAGSGTGVPSEQPCVPSATTQCGDSFSGGIDCVTPPSCSGDAVACGIANQEWLVRCQVVNDSDIATTIGTVTGPVNTTVDVSSVLSETGNSTVNGVQFRGGDSSCPQPITVTIAGRPMTLDIFAQFFQFMGYISVVVMTFAYMAAACVMFTGAVSNSL